MESMYDNHILVVVCYMVIVYSDTDALCQQQVIHLCVSIPKRMICSASRHFLA